MQLSKQRHETEIIKESFRECFVHMRSTGIPPRATLVCGRHPRPIFVKSTFHQIPGSGLRFLPLTPEDASQLAAYPTVQSFEDTFNLRQTEIVNPSSQYRCKRLVPTVVQLSQITALYVRHHGHFAPGFGISTLRTGSGS